MQVDLDESKFITTLMVDFDIRGLISTFHNVSLSNHAMKILTHLYSAKNTKGGALCWDSGLSHQVRMLPEGLSTMGNTAVDSIF